MNIFSELKRYAKYPVVPRMRAPRVCILYGNERRRAAAVYEEGAPRCPPGRAWVWERAVHTPPRCGRGMRCLRPQISGYAVFSSWIRFVRLWA